jgi:xylan 1,4-beta-xylosidase
LAQVHREIGFRYIRFHGIFHDDMDVYHERDSSPVYDFTRIDAVYDAIVRVGMKPFVELSFMPSELATGTKTVFWWKANGSPPKDYERWGALIEAFARHLERRYGKSEVASWPFEVWNEPNLDGFWTHGDQGAYFHLYDVTLAAIKKVDPDLLVGGPATAGAAWVPEMIAHTRTAGVPIDFISTHTYGVDGGFLDEHAEADQKLSQDPNSIIGDLRTVAAQVRASALPTLPIHFTEWSTSYSPRDPVHDAYVSAAFILEKVRKAEGLVASLSYWTYTDLFEEAGPPPTSFHGGFGLLNREGIRKAAFFAYKYLNSLGPVELPTSDPRSWITRKGNEIAALFWDYTTPQQHESDRPYFRTLHPATAVEPVALELQSLAPGRYRLAVYRTGFQANDAYSQYIIWGLPESLTAEQIAKLHALSADQPEIEVPVRVGSTGRLRRTFPMRTNDIVLVVLTPYSGQQSDSQHSSGP